MLLELANSTLIDPLHPLNGQRSSLFVRDGKLISPPSDLKSVAGLLDERRIDQRIDLQGAYVLAGGIDIHTHIGGGKVNLARLLMPPRHAEDIPPVWPTVRTGELYSEMGYTTCFEPAMLLSGARHTHLELADTPHLDSGAYVVLGNEDWILSALADGVEDARLDAILGWSVQASQAMAIKVVNPGGIHAFKFGQRQLAVDESHSRYAVTPREVIRRLSAAAQRIGLAHPLHVHASNLGMPGNIAATLATLDAAAGQPLHLTHAQFNSYSDSGPYGMGSGAEHLAKYVNSHPNISIDVGQIVFGQTVTISADTAAQFRNHRFASPNRWVVSDIECQAGCGIVPMRYEDKQYVHSLQWTIGLELMLLIEDPWRVFLTTDHPNGGPFTSYPHLMRLLMDNTFRRSMLETIHPRAAENSLLQELTREYGLDEIAIITRAAPARILGLKDRGTLCPGAIADLAAYQPKDNWQATFERASLTMKSGKIRRHGESCLADTDTRSLCQTIVAQPQYDASLLADFAESIEQALRIPMHSLEVSSTELHDLIRRPVTVAKVGVGDAN